MKIVNNTRISIKLVAAFATLVLIIACLAGVTAYELSQARDRVADTTRITYITDDVNALRQEVARQQAAVRGLLLSGNRDYIGKYETAKAEYERRLASLQPRLTVDVARQQLTTAAGEIPRWPGDIVARQDRQRVEQGKRGSERVDQGGS